MSSACVCHIDGAWCFYCGVYSPLEAENERLKAELQRAAEWKTRAQEAEDLAEYLRDENERLRGKLGDILDLIDAEYFQITHYPSAIGYIIKQAREALKDAAS